jgi:hypothetical protein
MKHFLSGFGLMMFSCLAFALPACTAETTDGVEPESGTAALASPGRGGAARHGIMPMRHASFDRAAAEPNASSVQLTYFGGPVISSVVVHAVYWGRDVAFQSHLNDFYGSVPNSSYLDWLSEYNTPTQRIGRGSFAGATVIQPGHTGTKLTDADIQDELLSQMDAGNLPQADGKNDLFMIHFPPSVSIALDAKNQSCVQFCAYHSTLKRSDDRLVFYGVMPDLVDTDCAQGCGGDSAQENTTAVASHEMVEAITDPAIGIAPPDGPSAAPMAWYNDTSGEIGDICNAQHGHQGSFTVQLQWSNHQRKCVASGPAH